MSQPNYIPYPDYKDSGVQWLGEIPSHWEVTRLKYQGKIVLGLTYSPENIVNENEGTLVLRSSNVQNGNLSFKDNVYVNADIPLNKITTDQDILICSRNGSRALIGKNALITGDAIGQSFGAFRPTINSNVEFLNYLIQSIASSDWFSILCNKATIAHLTSDKLSNTPIAIPLLNEQQAIVNFLDSKLEHIDSLISKQQQLLEKLAEQRTAVISHAVTKGLNPDAPMKDSGVEWLGEVPSHWEVKRMKFILSSPLKYGANESAELSNPEFPRYIRITDIKEDGTLKDESFRSIDPEIASNYLLENNDILLARSGATVGKSFIYRNFWGTSAYAGYLIRARTNNQANADYIYAFFQSLSYWNWLNSIFIQATIQNVSAEKYANLQLALPSLAEQQAIVQYLNQETARIDNMTKTTKDMIGKMQEYRSALITQAVTGKINVSNSLPTNRATDTKEANA